MEKVYLLLRNNIESGPYTIDELLQQQLKDSDLVWVEGKSLAWSYPKEIPELSMGSTEAVRPKSKPIVKKNKDEIEIRAEELRQRVLSFHPRQYHPVPYETEEFDNSGFVEEDAIEFIDHRKAKTFSLNEMLAAAMVTVIVGAGIYGGRMILSESQVNKPVITKVVSADNNAAKKNQTVVPVTVVATPMSVPLTDSISAKEPARPENYTKNNSVTGNEVIPADNLSEPVVVNSDVEENDIPTSSKTDETESLIKEPVKPVAIDTKEIIKPAVKKQETKTDSNKTIEAEQPEKKKTLGEALKGIFKKKKKTSDNLE